MRCNFYNFLSKKKIWDPPYDIHIYSYQVQSEFKIQGMEKLLLPISTLSTFPTGNLKLKYFSTSEKRYRLFGGKKKKKKKNSVRKLGSQEIGGAWTNRGIGWIGEWRDLCGYKYVRGPEGDFRGICARIRLDARCSGKVTHFPTRNTYSSCSRYADFEAGQLTLFHSR